MSQTRNEQMDQLAAEAVIEFAKVVAAIITLRPDQNPDFLIPRVQAFITRVRETAERVDYDNYVD